MKIYTTVVGCFLLGLAQGASANSNHPEDVYWPEFVLRSCSNIPPEGYALVEFRYIPAGSKCPIKWDYLFESYFDKPVGYEMEICQQGVPAGWFKVGERESVRCNTKLPPSFPRVGIASVIRRFS